MRILISVLLFFASLQARAANIDYHALLTNDFTTNFPSAFYVGVNTNTFPTRTQVTNIVIQNMSGGAAATNVVWPVAGSNIVATTNISQTAVTINGLTDTNVVNILATNVFNNQILTLSFTNEIKSLATNVVSNNGIDVAAGSNITITTNVNLRTISAVAGGITGGTTNVVTTNTPAGVTNFVDSEITNQIPNFIRGTTNQFAKFSPNTNTVGDSILSETTSNFVDLKAGGGAGTTPNGSLGAGYRVYGTFTNSTSFKRLDLDWSVADQAFRVLAEVGSSVGAGQAPILEIGASNLTWAVNTLGTLYPMSDNNYNLGGVSGRIKNVYVGTGGLQGQIGSSGALNYTVAGAGGWYDTGDTMGFVGISSGEQFRMAKAGGVGGAYFNLGANPLVGSPSGVTVQNSYLLSDGVNTWQIGTNLSSATLTTNRIHGPKNTGSNLPGGALFIGGGAATGSGASGATGFETATNGAATSTQAGYQTRYYISAHEVALTESTATLVANVTVPTKGYLGITLTATTHADDGTDFSSVQDVLSIAAINKAGTVTTSISASSPTATAASGGATLTTTWTAVANSSTVDIKCSAVSSLTQTTLSTKWMLTINSDGPAVVTAN